VKVAIVVPPYNVVGNASTTTSARENAGADELAEAMRVALGIDVPVVEAPLTSAPTEGYLLVFHTVPWVVEPELARRIIAFDEGRAYIMKDVEQYGFAGAVEMHRYFQWRTQRDRERGYGLIGRKDVAARMSESPPSSLDFPRPALGPYTSAHYDIIASDTARNLPELIVEYLKAYDAAP
jgi:hypothetical protein